MQRRAVWSLTIHGHWNNSEVYTDVSSSTLLLDSVSYQQFSAFSSLHLVFAKAAISLFYDVSSIFFKFLLAKV